MTSKTVGRVIVKQERGLYQDHVYGPMLNYYWTITVDEYSPNGFKGHETPLPWAGDGATRAEVIARVTRDFPNHDVVEG